MQGKIREMYQRQLAYEHLPEFIPASIATPFIIQHPEVAKQLENLSSTNGIQTILSQPVNPRGPLRLRELIAELLQKEDGITLPPNNIIITYGAIHAISLCLSSLFNNPTVCCFKPFFPNYKDIVDAAKGTFNPISYDDELPEADVLLFSDPVNPTGEKLPKSFLEQLGKKLEDRSTVMIVDEAYRDYYSREYCWGKVASKKQLDQSVLVGTVSKSIVVAPNMRLGWIASTNTDFINKFAKHLYSTVSSVSSVTSNIFEAVLEKRLHGSCPLSDMWMTSFHKKLMKRRNFIQHFSHNSIKVWGIPVIGLYCLLTINGSAFETDIEFCNKILEEEKIGLLPASIFGLPPEPVSIRVSMGMKLKTIQVAFAKIIKFVEAHSK